MRVAVRKSAKFLLILSASQIVLAVPAQASNVLVLNASMLALFQSATNQCFAYSYDLNGNRLALSSVTYSSTGTWGSSTYGCFNWTS